MLELRWGGSAITPADQFFAERLASDSRLGEYRRRANKKPRLLAQPGLAFRRLAVSYFRMAAATLSSALSVFTSEFGMGSGGSRSLSPPGKPARPHAKQA